MDILGSLDGEIYVGLLDGNVWKRTPEDWLFVATGDSWLCSEARDRMVAQRTKGITYEVGNVPIPLAESVIDALAAQRIEVVTERYESGLYGLRVLLKDRTVLDTALGM